MQLTAHDVEAATLLSGHESNIALSAGETLKIETSPGGEDVLAAECPAGKVWSARIIIEITETDA